MKFGSGVETCQVKSSELLDVNWWSEDVNADGGRQHEDVIIRKEKDKLNKRQFNKNFI